MLFNFPMMTAAAAFAGLAMILVASASPATGSTSNSNNDTLTMIKRDGTITVEHIDSGMLIKRAPGPSGSVVQPVGGTSIFTYNDWPGAGFRFIYKPAYVAWSDPSINCNFRRDACFAATKWLEVSLVSVSDPSKVYKLADYLHVSIEQPSANIDTWLGVPLAAVCGSYRLRVVETQRYFN